MSRPRGRSATSPRYSAVLDGSIGHAFLDLSKLRFLARGCECDLRSNERRWNPVGALGVLAGGKQIEVKAFPATAYDAQCANSTTNEDKGRRPRVAVLRKPPERIRSPCDHGFVRSGRLFQTQRRSCWQRLSQIFQLPTSRRPTSDWSLAPCHSRKLHPYGFARFGRISA